MKYRIGIDVGSTSTKAVVLDRDRAILHRLLQPTGWSSVDAAERVRTALEEWGVPLEDSAVVATGYGRISVPYADKAVTEITCHARGAAFLHRAPRLMIIDIGGQDTKLICTEGGQVQDFVMNDKCSAGTGRFLEIMANTLSLRPEELCALARRGGGVSISSMCTVFAESEVISLIGSGRPREDIAFAVMDSIVKKVCSQAQQIRTQDTAVCLTGGLCGVEPFCAALSKALGVPVAHCDDGRYAGAIGAALCAESI